MNHAFLRLSLASALGLSATAQGPDLLVTYSQAERTLSGSGGTVLRFLAPNEIAHLSWSNGPCATLSAEKFAPRTCFHTMAGDENGDSTYWNPTLFGTIDALCQAMPTSPVAGSNARDVFFSVSTPMGTAISGAPALRPGDVGHIVRNTFGDGQVEFFMRQEQFNQALGLPLNTPIDVDAIAWSPNHGVLFSLDQDINCFTACGATFVRDGDVLIVPPNRLTWTWDMRVATVFPSGAEVVYREAQFDAMVTTAQIDNRFGACIPNAVDLESIEIDWNGPGFTIVSCPGTPMLVPDLIFSTETMTGAGLLTTIGGGQIYLGLCGGTATPCGSGPTYGPQMGIRPTNATTGAPSWVNGLMSTFGYDHVLEPQQHVMNVFPLGAPAGANQIAYNSPYAFNLVFIELVPPTVPGSFPAFPFSLFCFPDVYIPNLFPHVPALGQFGTFPMVAIPPMWSGKVLFQSVGFGGSGFELSTPTVIDVQ